MMSVSPAGVPSECQPSEFAQLEITEHIRDTVGQELARYRNVRRRPVIRARHILTIVACRHERFSYLRTRYPMMPPVAAESTDIAHFFSSAVAVDETNVP